MHGANRLGGNALAETQVFGMRAGESAGKTMEREINVPDDQVSDAAGMLEGFLDGDVLPDQVKREVQGPCGTGRNLQGQGRP